MYKTKCYPTEFEMHVWTNKSGYEEEIAKAYSMKIDEVKQMVYGNQVSVIETNKGQTLIMVFITTKKDKTYVHEAVHVLQFLSELTGLEPSKEWQAYFVEYAYEEIKKGVQHDKSRVKPI